MKGMIRGGAGSSGRAAGSGGGWRTLFLLPAICLASGCIDLVPVGPPASRPAVLNLSLHVDEDLTDGRTAVVPVRVTAILDPGVDRGGLARRADGTPPVVAGFEFEAAGVDGSGRTGWAATIGITREVLLNGEVPVRGAGVRSLDTPEFAFRWPLFVRTGPEAFTVPAGSMARLGVAFVNLPGAPSATETRWSLAAFSADGWFSRGGSGLPAPETEFPVDALGGPGSELLAILSHSRTVEVGDAPGEYIVRIDLSQEARWDVSVEPVVDDPDK